MNKAVKSGDGPYLAVVAYRVMPRGPGKFSPAEAMNQCKFRALLHIKLPSYLLSCPPAERSCPIKGNNRQATTTI